MKYKVQTYYSGKLIALTALKYLIKSMGIPFYSALFLSAAIAVYLISSGNNTILPTVFSIVSIFGILIFLRMFSHYFSGANREYKKIKGTETWLTIREQGITFHGNADPLNWKDLHKAWATKEAFLFFTSKDSFIICPRQGLGDEISDFIIARLGFFRIPSDNLS